MKESPWRLLAIFWSGLGATCILAMLSLLVDKSEKLLALEALAEAGKVEGDQGDEEGDKGEGEVDNDNMDNSERCCKGCDWTAPFHTPFYTSAVFKWFHRLLFYHLNMSIYVLLYTVWLWVGVLWSCLYFKWDIITGLTFSFFAMSTAGLQPPGDTRDVGLLLTTGYVIVGVPLFAALCSLVITKIKTIFARARLKRIELLKARDAYRQRRDNLVALKEKVRTQDG
jgi:hypothetical protein